MQEYYNEMKQLLFMNTINVFNLDLDAVHGISILFYFCEKLRTTH